MSPHKNRRRGRLEVKALNLERKNDRGGGLSDEVKGALEELKESALDRVKRVEEELAEQKERADRLETALKRPHLGPEGGDKKGPTLEEKAFSGFLRRGAETLPETERKALTVGDNTQGGYLTTTQFEREVLKNLVQFSPVRQVARVGSMSKTSITIPRRTSAPTAQWVTETGERPQTQQAYGQLMIPSNEMAAYIDVSNKLLEDAEFSVDQEIANDLAEEFARLEGTAFVLGDSVNKPQGFLAHADVPQVASGHATQITADALIDLLYSLPEFYRSQSTWMMNGTTQATVRKLKDGQGQYLWQPGIAAGQPPTILGRPVLEAIDLPDVQAGAFPIALGAFRHGYRIYDRVGMTILRDPYTLATSGQVRFHARRRVGGGVVKTEALRKMKIAVSL